MGFVALFDSYYLSISNPIKPCFQGYQSQQKTAFSILVFLVFWIFPGLAIMFYK